MNRSCHAFRFRSPPRSRLPPQISDRRVDRVMFELDEPLRIEVREPRPSSPTVEPWGAEKEIASTARTLS